MSKLKRSSVILVVLVGLLGLSSVAMADHDETHEGDTVINFGYDAINHFLAINIDPDDVEHCRLASGALPATYENEVDGVYEVGLGAAYDICEVNGVVVAGPNGQINHGQFMKAAKSLLGIKGGCLVRYLAQSDIGRTDQTRVSTSEAAETPFLIGMEGEIKFSTFDADCSRGNGKEAKAENENRGRPDSPGKSAAAPGRDS